MNLDEKGVTLQVVILAGILALAATVLLIALWNAFLRQRDSQPGEEGGSAPQIIMEVYSVVL